MKKLIPIFALLLLVALIKLQASTYSSINSPELPKIWLATTLNSANFPDLFSSPVMKTVCASGCNYTSLQTAWSNIGTDAPNCGEIITVTSGYVADSLTTLATDTYGYTCPAGKHVWVRSSTYTSLPPQGTTVGPSDKTNMFVIDKAGNATSGQNFTAAITVSDGASGLVVTGCDTELSGFSVGYGWEIGSNTNSSNFAHDIFFDRSYIDTTYATLVNNAIYNDGNYTAFTDNRVDHIGTTTASACGIYSETHDYEDYNAQGPVKLVDNYLGGAPTENYFEGGATPVLVGSNPSDLEIRRNIFFKDPSQIPNADIKNNFEFKDGIRVLVDGNVMQYSQADWKACGGDQYGVSVDFNVTNPGGGECTWCSLRDVTFTNNVIQHMNGFFALQGHGFANGPQWPVEQRILIQNNLFQDENHWKYVTSPTVATTAASITSNVATLTVASTAGFKSNDTIAVLGFTGADAVFNTTGTAGTGQGQPITALTSTTISYNDTNANYTATGNGTVGNVRLAISGFTLGSGGFGGAFPAGTNGDPGPRNVTISNNGFYGSANNGDYLCYINSPSGEGSGFRTSVPSFTYTNNVSVLDNVVTYPLGGDGGESPYALITHGTFPNSQWLSNVMFNAPVSSGIACLTGTGGNGGDWPPSGTGSNPGVCPAGLASSPTTINSTLGIANYALCSAGDTTAGSASISNCAITGTYSYAGPNIAQIQAAQSEPNDSTKWGPRTPF